MSAPPTYNESQQQNPPAGAYQPSYGTVNPPPAGAYQYPPAGAAYPPAPGAGYPPAPGAGYPPAPGYDKPAGQYPHSAGYAYPAPAGSVPSYQTGNNLVITQPAQSVVVVGGCPACRVGYLEDDFTCLGVLCAILFFPIGILCCLAMRQRRCGNCGAVFG